MRKRISAEGGADIDVERLLDESLKESEEMEKASQEWLLFKQQSEPPWSS